MKDVVGSPGTWSGMALRVSQCVFAGASSAVMSSAFGFSNYTAYWYFRTTNFTLALATHRCYYRPRTDLCLGVVLYRGGRSVGLYLIASMALQLLWSFGLACLDIYSLRNKKDLHNPVLVSLFVVGDWVTAILIFAAASASAGVTILFVRDVHFCRTYPQLACGRYELSVILAFITWSFTATSAASMFWLLASF